MLGDFPVSSQKPFLMKKVMLADFPVSSQKPFLMYTCNTEQQLADFLGLPGAESSDIGCLDCTSSSSSSHIHLKHADALLTSNPLSVLSLMGMPDFTMDLMPDGGLHTHSRNKRLLTAAGNSTIEGRPCKNEEILPDKYRDVDGPSGSGYCVPRIQFVNHWGRQYGTPISSSALIRPGLLSSDNEGSGFKLVQPDGRIPVMTPWKR
jgi:hypothetical protein